MAAKIPVWTRAVGVLGGLIGALVTGAFGFAIINWLLQPFTGTDALLVLFTFGAALVFAWAGVLSSLIMFGISVHAVFDALGRARGNSARRLAIVSVLLLALVLAAAISDGEATPIAVALLVLGPIAGLNVAAPMLYGRALRAQGSRKKSDPPA